MKFVDETQIRIRSGKGGSGMVSFRSGKNAPKLGADGGDGGFGGHVYLQGNPQLNTLSSLYYKKIYQAEDGAKGGPNGRTGRNGVDCVIPVPMGTIAVNLDSGEEICEILNEEPVLIAEGGRRGLGNIRYLSSTHQAPHEFKSGGPAIEFDLGLELKLIADVGFAGFPNAGKSTLLSVLSAAKPRIADYPFTTLEPQLGVVDLADCGDYWDCSFVAADIPGLIEGASDGKGLGHEFLRHLERTQLIAYVIDTFPLDERSPRETFDILKHELSHFGEDLGHKKSCVILTKADLAPEDFDLDSVKRAFEKMGLRTFFVSSATKDNIKSLKQDLYHMVEAQKAQISEVYESEEEISEEKSFEDYELVTAASLSDQLESLR